MAMTLRSMAPKGAIAMPSYQDRVLEAIIYSQESYSDVRALHADAINISDTLRDGLACLGAMCQAQQALEGAKELSQASTTAVMSALHAMQTSLGFQPVSYSTESDGGNHLRTAQEGFVSAIGSVLMAIINGIRRFVSGIFNFFKRLFGFGAKDEMRKANLRKKSIAITKAQEYLKGGTARMHGLYQIALTAEQMFNDGHGLIDQDYESYPKDGELFKEIDAYLANQYKMPAGELENARRKLFQLAQNCRPMSGRDCLVLAGYAGHKSQFTSRASVMKLWYKRINEINWRDANGRLPDMLKKLQEETKKQQLAYRQFEEHVRALRGATGEPNVTAIEDLTRARMIDLAIWLDIYEKGIHDKELMVQDHSDESDQVVVYKTRYDSITHDEITLPSETVKRKLKDGDLTALNALSSIKYRNVDIYEDDLKAMRDCYLPIIGGEIGGVEIDGIFTSEALSSSVELVNEIQKEVEDLTAKYRDTPMSQEPAIHRAVSQHLRVMALVMRTHLQLMLTPCSLQVNDAETGTNQLLKYSDACVDRHEVLVDTAKHLEKLEASSANTSQEQP